MDISKSRLAKGQLQEWLNKTDIDGDLSVEKVPFIGPRTIAKLEKNGFGKKTGTFELLAKFLSLRTKGDTNEEHCKKFFGWLKNVAPKAKGNEVVHALIEKLNKGFKANIAIPENLTSRLGKDERDAFKKKALTGDPVKDFNGLGAESAKNLAKLDVTSTWQIFGKLLESRDSKIFQSWLTEAGVAAGYTGQITQQLCDRFNAGLKL